MAGRVARTWRGKHLEYMFRDTAIGQFPRFADLTRWSLAWALAKSGIAPARQDENVPGPPGRAGQGQLVVPRC